MDKVEGDMDGESPVLKHPKTPTSEHTEHTEHTHNRGTNDDGTVRPVPIAEQPSVVDVDLGDSELVLQSTLTTRVPLLENGEAGTAIELLQRVEGGGGRQTVEQPEKEGLRETFENEEKEKKGENTKGPEEKVFGCNQWWLIAAICLIVGAAGTVTVSIIKVQGDEPPNQYGIVMDAGSTHTALYVYRWLGDPANRLNGTGVVKQIASDSCGEKGKGISAYTADPSKAGMSLRRCLDRTALSAMPGYEHPQTQIYLGSTAGMRLVNLENATVSNEILNSVRKTVKTYPFNFSRPLQQARIISGEEEGHNSWITANYLIGTFGNFARSSWYELMPSTPADTMGVLDMGGASTQMTFVPKNGSGIPPQHRTNFRLYGASYTVYTNSFLCYGLKESGRRHFALLAKEHGYNSTITDPCGPKGNMSQFSYDDLFGSPCTQGTAVPGTAILNPEEPVLKDATFYFEGSSDYQACNAQVDKLFNFTGCSYPKCSFNGVYMPELYGNYLGISGYYYTMKDLNLTREGDNFTLGEFTDAVRQMCQRDWDYVKNIPTKLPEGAVRWCFESAYIHTLLTKGYGFNETNWSSLKFKNKLLGTSVGWAIGFMINATNGIPEEMPYQPFSNSVFGILIFLFIVFLILAVSLACYAKRFKVPKGPYNKLAHYGTV